ncbi:MAG TPA: plasmid partitioning protein RepB C-terminal domain-containing protein [Opitutaceae bacterium]|jgi:ParB family chromosome partitioning protein|nr:plasmid partitioning protein RepB C-terminal domain-containing protein [Opitutaceae bacterium]
MISAAESLVRLIPVDRVRIVNPRVRDKKKFERIVESIAKLGLKKPITVTVRKAGDDGKETFDLVCGQGRLEAFIALGQREIPALVRGLSKNDSLLASLIENIARRRVSSLDQIKMIQWMKGQGHGYADIARKTGLAEEYIKHILGMLKNGEERLLEAVLHGKIPVTIAIGISGASDEESQRLLMEAYERKDMNQKTLLAFKRVVDQRRHFGRNYGPRAQRLSRRTSAESMVMAYRRETQRQKLMVKKAKICEGRLLSMSAIFKSLMKDEDYINLLRAEKLETMPKFLAERVRKIA